MATFLVVQTSDRINLRGEGLFWLPIFRTVQHGQEGRWLVAA